MTRRSFQYLLASAAFPGPTLSAQDDARAILAKATEAYQSLRSYYFEGKTTAETTIKGKTTRSELGFVVAFEAPDRFRLEFRYPSAGNWLRVSDGKFLMESRSITKETRKTPITQSTIWTLKSSPLYNFERLSETAENPMLIRSDTVEVDGKQFDCHLIQFTSHRRELREGETAGPSMVWVAKDTALVLREEIRTSASVRGEVSESKRVTTIERFGMNENLSGGLLSTGAPRR